MYLNDIKKKFKTSCYTEISYKTKNQLSQEMQLPTQKERSSDIATSYTKGNITYSFTTSNSLSMREL